MNRINQLFQDSPKNLLSIYFCAGCPTLEGTADADEADKRGIIINPRLSALSASSAYLSSLY